MKTRTSFLLAHIPGNAVLTAQNAVDIRAKWRDGSSMSDLARIYGVSYQHIWAIVRRHKWRNAERQTAAALSGVAAT